MLQRSIHRLRKSQRLLRPRAVHAHAVKHHPLGLALPFLCIQMRLMPGRSQRPQQPLHIQLRASGGGVLAADEGEFHTSRANVSFATGKCKHDARTTNSPPATAQSSPSPCERPPRSADT